MAKDLLKNKTQLIRITNLSLLIYLYGYCLMVQLGHCQPLVFMTLNHICRAFLIIFTKYK